MPELLSTYLLVSFIFFNIAFLFSFIKDDISFIDVGWGLSFVVLILFMGWNQQHTITFAQLMAVFLVSSWGLRLCLYLYLRNSKKGEDPRYQELSKHWRGPKWLNAYFRVFVMQSIAHMFIGIPIYTLFVAENIGFGLLAILAVAICIFAIIFESLADSQLDIFMSLKEKPSRFCRLGVWKHSRHPNYFAEMVFWWGLGLLAFAATYQWYVFIGPAMISLLLVKVSGIPPLVRKFKEREGWDEYVKETNLLLPIPKK